MRYRACRIAVLGLAAGLLAGCMSPDGATKAEKRQAVQDMRAKTLSKLYDARPEARARVKNAVGYGVFSNVGVNLILLSAGNGWGVVRDSRSGEDVYMKMATAGLGLGLGVKDFRGVFIFSKESALDNFVEDGWEAGGQADAAAKAADKGGALAGAATVAPGVHLYQLTENGLALQATVQGTKYWKADDLN